MAYSWLAFATSIHPSIRPSIYPPQSHVSHPLPHPAGYIQEPGTPQSTNTRSPHPVASALSLPKKKDNSPIHSAPPLKRNINVVMD
jgi:hypothetical protein